MAKQTPIFNNLHDTITFLQNRPLFTKIETRHASKMTSENLNILAEFVLLTYPKGVPIPTSKIEKQIECALFSAADELYENLVNLSSKIWRERTLEYFVTRYGKIEGSKRFGLYKENDKQSKSKYAGISMIKVGAIKRGCQEEEANEKVKLTQQKAVQSRNNKTRIELCSDPLYTKKKSPFSPYFEGFTDSFTKHDQEILIKRTLGKGQGFHYLSVDERKRKYQDMWANITANNISSVSKGKKAQKESLKFFTKLVDMLDLQSHEYYCAQLIEKGEWWIKDFETNTYYFLDFYIPSLKFAIEYNGASYHPKSKNYMWTEKSGLIKHVQAEEMWQRDRRKEYQAALQDISIEYIWSDSDLELELKRLTIMIQNMRNKL